MRPPWPPASTDTTPVDTTIWRMMLNVHSHVYTVAPAASTATPRGWLKSALVPAPLAKPAAVPPALPPPASTLTKPTSMASSSSKALPMTIWRMSDDVQSATKSRLPATATAAGFQNRALVPMAGRTCPPPPATDVTAPVATMMRRTRLLFQSATKTLPLLSAAMPRGALKRALVPTPLAKPAKPQPWLP